MKIFLIILIAILAILVVCFISWFMTMKVNGKCPLCAIKKVFIPTKLTIDIKDVDDYPSKAAPTPPMGWSSWNTFRNKIDQDLILQVAKAMKNSGLGDLGYKYVNLDDCWQSSIRDSDGKMQGDLKTFSRGIPALVKSVNDLGLKVGIYSSNGDLTCEDLPASLGNETLDARTFASWGIEYLKYDFCHNHKINPNCPAIEYITINKPEGSFETKLTPYDAEFTGRAKVINISNLPSKKAIGFISHGSGTATFNVDATSKGKYCFTVGYHKTTMRKEQYMQVIVNGKLYEMYFPKTLGFTPTARAQIMIDLNEGENVITIQNPVLTKIDSSYIQYKRMGDAVKEATAMWAQVTRRDEKPMVFSICEWGTALPRLWGAKAGNMWRTTHDIFPNWKSITWIYNRNIKQYKHTTIGHYADPDMLEVGNGKLTYDENVAHFSLWCMMAAPLMLGNDVRDFVDDRGIADKNNETLKIVSNKNLIDIDQDSLVRSAKRIKKSGGVDVIARPLSNGDIAVCAFNTKNSTTNFKMEILDFTKDEYLNFNSSSNYEVHDLWSDEIVETTKLSVSIPKHGVVVYRINNI